jgi:phage regulator Rha-like protein
MQNEIIKIKNMIYEIRGYQVMLDEDLAKIYQVETKVLNQAVKRNADRFPLEFMFQLTEEEYTSLRSQIVTSKNSRGGRRYLPFVFTEHGIVMLSSVLNSKIATQINIAVVNAFIEMRHYTLSQSTTNAQIGKLHKLLMLHIENSDYKFSEYDDKISQIVHVLNNLIEQTKRTKPIGFNTE